MNERLPYCVNCHEHHEATKDCVPCEFNPQFLHKPMPQDIHFDFKGWRFTPPFLCFYCGRNICFEQWAFSRCCGRCDVGKGPRTDKIFSGPRMLIDKNAQYFLEEDRFFPDGTKPLPYPNPPRTFQPRPKPPRPPSPPRKPMRGLRSQESK